MMALILKPIGNQWMVCEMEKGRVNAAYRFNDYDTALRYATERTR